MGAVTNTVPRWLELKKKISVKESFRRHYRHLIKKVSPRRDGVELGDALAIGQQSES